MKKFYDKSELWFSLFFIMLYTGSTIPIRGELGDNSIWMLIALLIIASIILLFIKKHKLEEKYGINILPKNPKKYFYFIPLIILAFGNLWGGIKLHFNGISLAFACISMALIGFVEEIIFRGFLFRAIEKNKGAKQAITISAITFGIGHFVNLFAGQANIDTILQIIFAISMGFVFTFVFYKSKSIWPCVLTHAIVNVTAMFSMDNQIIMYIYLIVSIIISIIYCSYLSKLKEN